MINFLHRLRSREAQVLAPIDDDRLLVALVNEARTDAQRSRIVELARRRASAHR
jgi:hypothetical protein